MTVTDRGARKWVVFTVLAAVAFMAQLDLFIVNIAMPSIGSSFAGSPISSLSWVLNGYAIVFAALLVPAGRLADHFGRRRFLLAGILVFIAASSLCAIAPSLEVLIGGRLLQAVGAAMIVPTSLGLLLPVFPAHQHNLAVGAWAATGAVAASAGPPIGGLLVAASWRWIFLVNLPVGVFALLLGLRVVPEIRAAAGARLPDPTSVIALLAAVTLLTFGLVKGPEWGWGSGRLIAVLAGAALAAGLTLSRTLRHPHAVIERSLFESFEFRWAAVALFLFYVAFADFLLVTVFFLQDVWHYSPLEAGLAIAPGPMTAAVFAAAGGRIMGRIGRTASAAIGAGLTAVAALFWLRFAPGSPDYVTHFLPGMLIGGTSAGLTQAPLFAAASTLPAERASTGSAVLNMARQLGSAVGVAALVALLATSAPSTLGQIHRGWWLQAAAALGASSVVVLARVGARVRSRAYAARAGTGAAGCARSSIS